MELVKIGVIVNPHANPNIRIRAKHFGAIIIRNYAENVDEVYAHADKAEYVKSKMFPNPTLIEKGGEYFYVTTDALVKITYSEYAELKSKISNN